MYLQEQHKIWLATGESPIYLEPSMANRHGLIAGATGTGKTSKATSAVCASPARKTSTSAAASTPWG